MMVCPKCKAEYENGNSRCSDCDVDLIQYNEPKVITQQINEKGIRLIRYGISLMFLTIFEIIAIIIAYDFYWIYKLSHGGVSGTAMSNVNPAIWFLVILELIGSIITIFWGSSYKDNISNKISA